MFDKTTLVKWLFLIICGHNQAIGPDDVEKVFDTLRDGGAFEADFAACCRPAAASCLLFTAWCLYVVSESLLVTACVLRSCSTESAETFWSNLARKKKKKANAASTAISLTSR